jgi:hypothetical protein
MGVLKVEFNDVKCPPHRPPENKKTLKVNTVKALKK